MKTKYKLNKGFITQKIAKKTVVFSGQQSILFSLNETAELIFQGLKLGWDEEKIISVLISDYDIEPKEARRDVEEFKQMLLDKKILVKEKN